jgi:hypothetical protein
MPGYNLYQTFKINLTISRLFLEMLFFASMKKRNVKYQLLH